MFPSLSVPSTPEREPRPAPAAWLVAALAGIVLPSASLRPAVCREGADVRAGEIAVKKVRAL